MSLKDEHLAAWDSLALFNIFITLFISDHKGEKLKIFSVISHVLLMKQSLQKDLFSQMSNISSVLTEKDG